MTSMISVTRVSSLRGLTIFYSAGTARPARRSRDCARDELLRLPKNSTRSITRIEPAIPATLEFVSSISRGSREAASNQEF